MATAAVVIPVYATPENHRLDFLGQTLQSVRHQTYPDLVAVVVDDGSTADVAGFVREQRMDNVRYVRRVRSPADLKTASNALNFGIGLCLDRSPDVFSSGEASGLAAITYLHSDDMLPPESIGKRLSVLNSDAAFVYADVAYIGSSNELVGVSRSKSREGIYASSLFRGFPHHTVMWGIEFVDSLRDYVARRYGQNGIFDSRLSHGEDRDASISSVEATKLEGKAMIHLPVVAYVYRQHMQSISGERISEDYRKAQSRLIDAKHFSEQNLMRLRLGMLFQNMTYNLPWSLGFWLPEHFKENLRPVKRFVQKASVAGALSLDEKTGLEGLLVTQPSRPPHF